MTRLYVDRLDNTAEIAITAVSIVKLLREFVAKAMTLVTGVGGGAAVPGIGKLAEDYYRGTSQAGLLEDVDEELQAAADAEGRCSVSEATTHRQVAQAKAYELVRLRRLEVKNYEETVLCDYWYRSWFYDGAQFASNLTWEPSYRLLAMAHEQQFGASMPSDRRFVSEAPSSSSC